MSEETISELESKPHAQQQAQSESGVPVRSLKELIDRVTGRGFNPPESVEPAGLAEAVPFPFLALVGQREMKLALMLALINPAIGGVLLIGPRGTGKTTAVRSLVDLLPSVPRSLCYYGCLPEDVESGGMDAVCPDCARKYAQGESLAKMERGRLVELPLNARLEDVIGSIDERAELNKRMRLHRGLLSQADQNILYVDEVNLLGGEIVDALLDAAAQGTYTVRRGAHASTYWSRFIFIGSMNPEEGKLRPQIQDRFGLRILVHGLEDREERLEAYRRVQAYSTSPRRVVSDYVEETEFARDEIQAAREMLPRVMIPDDVAYAGLEITNRLKIDSLRAEITLFEAARAYAAADSRATVSLEDLQIISPLALRLRRSGFMQDYFSQQMVEEKELSGVLADLFDPK